MHVTGTEPLNYCPLQNLFSKVLFLSNSGSLLPKPIVSIDDLSNRNPHFLSSRERRGRAQEGSPTGKGALCGEQQHRTMTALFEPFGQFLVRQRCCDLNWGWNPGAAAVAQCIMKFVKNNATTNLIDIITPCSYLCTVIAVSLIALTDKTPNSYPDCLSSCVLNVDSITPLELANHVTL